MKEIFSEKQHSINIRLESPIFEIPFNSKGLVSIEEYDSDSAFNRKWILNLGNIEFKTKEVEEMAIMKTLSQKDTSLLDPYDIW